jgi:hypothetical protein
MNTAKKLAPTAEACTVQEFDQVATGHTLHFVSDRLNLMLGLWAALSAREYWVWSQLMVRVRESRSFDIEITHRTLCQYSSVSEATIRGVLERLSTLGFIEILDKKINRYGKNYLIRPALPKHLLPKLKAELDRCRDKDKLVSKTYVRDKAPTAKKIYPALTLIPSTAAVPAMNTSYSAKLAPSPSSPEIKLLDETAENQYLSWDGHLLSKEEAYLPITEKFMTKAPYQSNKNKNWTPSFSDLKATISPFSQNPTTEEAKGLQIDVAVWAIETQVAFFKQCHERSNSKGSYFSFLAQQRLKLDGEFPAYLAQMLPQGTQSWIPTLLERMQAYQSPYSNKWFPLTKEMLNKKQAEYEATLKNQGSDKPSRSLSPDVAVCIPTTLLNRIITMVKRFKLSQEKILEIAYHVMNFSPNKIHPNAEEKQEHNLCIAIQFLQQGSWGCPLSLEAKRTRYKEGVK